MTNILIFAAYNFWVSEKKKTINEKEELSQYEEVGRKNKKNV